MEFGSLKNKKKKAKGMLPSKAWLMKNDKVALVGCIQRHPEMFEHIPQNTLRKDLDELVLIAEKLEKKYGILPCPYRLREIRSGLVPAMKQNPERFAHIKQEWKQGKSLEDTVKHARELEKKHGMLPCKNWLQNNGEGALYSQMCKYPESFAHIKQESKKGRTLEESIKYAEDLAFKNGGKLPKYSSLIKNGDTALYAMIYNYRESFAHIEIEKTFNNVYDAVAIAEELESKYGEIPQGRWLIKNGNGWMLRHMSIHPDKFKHIKKANPSRRTLDENVKLAEKIAKDNGGVLPTRGVLSKIYSGLTGHIRKYPKKFAHIKQEYRGGRNDEENLRLAKKLIKQNGGFLPTFYWMRKNDYGGLEMCIRTKTFLFKGMKIEYGNTWNREVKVIGEE